MSRGTPALQAEIVEPVVVIQKDGASIDSAQGDVERFSQYFKAGLAWRKLSYPQVSTRRAGDGDIRPFYCLGRMAFLDGEALATACGRLTQAARAIVRLHSLQKSPRRHATRSPLTLIAANQALRTGAAGKIARAADIRRANAGAVLPVFRKIVHWQPRRTRRGFQGHRGQSADRLRCADLPAGDPTRSRRPLTTGCDPYADARAESHWRPR